MKKLFFLILLLCCFPLTSYAYDNSANTIEPRASYVFDEVASTVSRTYYGGECLLYDSGNGTIVITLQKKNSSGVWADVSGTTSRLSFANKSIQSHSVGRILGTGTYRCKTYVIATVNGLTESKTVYSPSLTLTPNN